MAEPDPRHAPYTANPHAHPDSPAGSGGTLLDEYKVWLKNDFGVWSWRLHDLGSKHRNAYFIHTTPDNEVPAAGRGFFLGQSHGCIHIWPKDRDDMMTRGYLKPGIRVDVKRYGAIGPPR